MTKMSIRFLMIENLDCCRNVLMCCAVVFFINIIWQKNVLIFRVSKLLQKYINMFSFYLR